MSTLVDAHDAQRQSDSHIDPCLRDRIEQITAGFPAFSESLKTELSSLVAPLL